MSAQANILVIDDDREVLDVVEDLLTESGYKVTTAENGQEALAALDEGDFDLAVVDLSHVLPAGEFRHLTHHRALAEGRPHDLAIHP